MSKTHIDKASMNKKQAKVCFCLDTRIIAKKNSKQWIFRGGRKYLVPSDAFRDFAQYAVEYLTYFVVKKYGTLKPPYSCSYQIFMKGKEYADLDNMIASINDCMEKAGLIENDRFVQKYVEPTEAVPNAPKWMAKVVLYGFSS